MTGVTRTEELLFDFCAKSFLRLWSYANPFKDDGCEFCDVLAVFGNHAFIFFDREKAFSLPEKAEDFSVAWERWKRTAIFAQIRTAHGAERYLRSGRNLYLDARKERAFPLPIHRDGLIVHKIIVAHGVAQACKDFSADNITGSLAIAYGPAGDDAPFPFFLSLEKERPVHVLDSSSLPIILGELDTIRDFAAFLDAKVAAIEGLTGLSYCGEEDLLGHYFLNLNADQKHFVGTDDPAFNFVGVEEGTWEGFKNLPQYAATKAANRSSYLWDEIINKTCDNFLQGKLLGDSDLYGPRSAIHEMAKEPRFMRRKLADWMVGAIEKFPDVRTSPNRYMRYLPSIDPGRGYIFLQLWIPERMRTNEEEDRAKRQEILAIACGAAKNRMPELHTVVGIGIEPPKLSRTIAEDFVLLDCADWPEQRRREFEQRNEGWDFFKTDNLKVHKDTAHEFVRPPAGV